MAFSAIILSGLFFVCQTIHLTNGSNYQAMYSWSLPGTNNYKDVTPEGKIFDQEHQTSPTTSPNDYYNNPSAPYIRNINHNNTINGVEDTSNNTHALYHHTDVNVSSRAVIDGIEVSRSNWGLDEVPSQQLNKRFPALPNDVVHPIVGGERADSAKAPPLQWHVGIYSKAFVPYMQVCGGTLVTTKAVISAAHCFWSDLLDGALPPSGFAVATGKLYRPWNDSHDIYAQKSEISAVHLPPRFRGASTSFQDDIAVVVLTSTLVLSNAVRPVCVLLDEDLESDHLRAGNHGIVLGWGLTEENGPPAQALQYLTMPYVPIEDCVADAQSDFLKYITSDKICAGVTTGKALCRGDSGGGLVFFDRSSGDRERVPFLFGVASTAPRNENLCNAYARATLTRLLAHRKFLRAHVPDIEQSCGYSYQSYNLTHKADLVRLADRSSETQTTRKATQEMRRPKYICNCHCNCNNSTKC